MEAKELIRRYRAGEREFAGATLSEADLQGADLHEANLAGANLSHAQLREVYLRTANLSHANLEGANVAPGQLTWEVTLKLDGATMPDGTKHE
jgi:uncharacterized protein YjbI with pentapeptide repeats